jgi:hypothetical protein
LDFKEKKACRKMNTPSTLIFFQFFWLQLRNKKLKYMAQKLKNEKEEKRGNDFCFWSGVVSDKCAGGRWHGGAERYLFVKEKNEAWLQKTKK